MDMRSRILKCNLGIKFSGDFICSLRYKKQLIYKEREQKIITLNFGELYHAMWR